MNNDARVLEIVIQSIKDRAAQVKYINERLDALAYQVAKLSAGDDNGKIRRAAIALREQLKKERAQHLELAQKYRRILENNAKSMQNK